MPSSCSGLHLSVVGRDLIGLNRLTFGILATFVDACGVAPTFGLADLGSCGTVLRFWLHGQWTSQC